MTDRTRQPAVLLRRIAKLEALLAAEKEISDRANTAYRETLYELVDAQMKLKRIEEVMRGDDD